MDIATNPGPVNTTSRSDYLNARSYEVVCICETWLNNTVYDSELLPNFNVFRQDRIGKIGGGVLIGVKEGLRVTRCADLERDGVELLVVQLNKANIKPLFFRYIIVLLVLLLMVLIF